MWGGKRGRRLVPPPKSFELICVKRVPAMRCHDSAEVVRLIVHVFAFSWSHLVHYKEGSDGSSTLEDRQLVRESVELCR